MSREWENAVTEHRTVYVVDAQRVKAIDRIDELEPHLELNAASEK